jgi:proteasome lid subunit RPN8/RPN11
MFDRQRYERALKQIDEAPTLDDYYAGLVALAEAQGRTPNPQLRARAEGRSVEPGEWEAWRRQLGIGNVDGTSNPGSARWSPSREVAGRSDDGVGHGRRRPRWHLPTGEAARRQSRRSRSEPAQEAPELLETGSGFTIQLAASACEAMEREVLESIWQFDSLAMETGGWLYSHYRPDGGRQQALVIHASGPGRNGEHSVGSVRLSDPREVERDFDDLTARAGLIRVGDWHSHPARDPIPSHGDLTVWANNSDRAGVLPWSSVILTPGELGWAVPDFHGYVTREDDEGLLVCEPAVVRTP